MRTTLVKRLPRRVLCLLTGVALAAAACGSGETIAGPAVEAEVVEESVTTTTPTTVEETATTEAKRTTTTAAAATSSTVDPDTPEGAAMMAWSTVFDSAVAFESKAAHLENAEALETSNAAYAASGETMGGIALQATAATVEGDIATITYDVYFGENPAYTDLEGEALLTNGVWVVSEASYCDFLGSARTPCQT